MGPAGPASALAAGAGYPEDSMSRQLLERCMEAAVARGVDVTAEYKPWLPVDLLQTLIMDVHDAVGCSWIMAIVLACLSIRAVTLPVSIMSVRGAREKALIQPEFMRLTENNRAMSMEGDQAKAQKAGKELQDFQQKHGKFFMLKGTWNFICFQMPIYITAFAAMRGFAAHPDLFRGFAMEAPLWLESLALPDPYMVMPVLTAAMMLTNAEIFGSIDTETGATADIQKAVQASTGAPESAPQDFMQRNQKWIMRGSMVAFVPMTMNFPAGVFVFMCTNVLTSALQTRILRLPVLERLLELPPSLESVQAAEAVAKGSGPRALVPLGATLSRAVSGAALGKAKPAAARPAPAAPVGPALAAVAKAAAAAPKGLEGVQVNPRFAVSRARTSQPKA